MATVRARRARRPARTVLLSERFLSGAFGGHAYENCLTVSLTTHSLRLQPAAWVPSRRALEIPLDQVSCAYLNPSRLAPTIELHYPAWGGGQTCRFSPRNQRLWAEYLDELGVVLRPHGLEIASLPRRNLGYRLRVWGAMAGAAAAAAALAAAACRFGG